jgi:hypothetical protein
VVTGAPPRRSGTTVARGGGVIVVLTDCATASDPAHINAITLADPSVANAASMVRRTATCGALQ